MSDHETELRNGTAVLAREDALVVGPAAGALRCASCGQRVTRREFLLEFAGANTHSRTNPHGFTFTFQLFALAPGSHARGAPTLAATWFPPYAWQVAHCARCGMHLGWCFSDGTNARHYGLINARLREEHAA